MPKTYMRYEPEDSFNVVVTTPGGLFDQTGRFVVAAALNKLRLTVANTNALQLEVDFNINSEITYMLMHPQYQQIAVGFKNGQIVIYDLDSQEQVSVFQSVHTVTSLLFTPDGTALVAGHVNGEIVVFDLLEGAILKKLEKQHGQMISSMIFYNEFLVTGSRDRLVNVWCNFQRFQVLTDFPSQIVRLTVVNDLLFVITEETDVRVFSFRRSFGSFPANFLATGETLTTLNEKLKEKNEAIPAQEIEPIESNTHTILFPMGRFERSKGRIFSVMRRDSLLAFVLERTIETYVVKNEKEVADSRKQRIQRIVKNRLEKGSDDLNSNIEEYTINDCLITDVVIAVSEKIINADCQYYANQENTVKVLVTFHNQFKQFDVDLKQKNYEMIGEENQKGHSSSLIGACYNDDQTLLISTSKSQLKVWSVRKALCVSTVDLPDQVKAVQHLTVLKGNLFCLLGDASGIVYVVDLMANQIANAIQLHEGKITGLNVFNNQLYSASIDGFLKISSFRFDNVLQIIQERELNCEQGITSIEICDKYIFTSLADFTAKCYHRDTFKYKFSFYGHSLAINQLIISPTLERIYTISADKTIRTWGLQFGECMNLTKLQEIPTSIVLIPETHLAFIGLKDGKILYYDLDSYIQICHLGEANYGQRFQPGHFGACTQLLMAQSGRFITSIGADNCIRTWVQSNDLVSIEDELNKANQRYYEEEVRLQKNAEWENQVKNLDADKMDILENLIGECYLLADAPESNVDLEECRDYRLLNGLFKFNKQLIPIYIQNLSLERSKQLFRLLVLLLSRGRNEQIAWILLRLIRTNLSSVGMNFQETGKLILSVLNEKIHMSDLLLGKLSLESLEEVKQLDE